MGGYRSFLLFLCVLCGCSLPVPAPDGPLIAEVLGVAEALPEREGARLRRLVARGRVVFVEDIGPMAGVGHGRPARTVFVNAGWWRESDTSARADVLKAMLRSDD